QSFGKCLFCKVHRNELSRGCSFLGKSIDTLLILIIFNLSSTLQAPSNLIERTQHGYYDSSMQLLSLEARRVETTPKSLMRVMSIHGLTLYHLKSHLQKYTLGTRKK
ncbi:hypothetical protein M8C21_015313, partial [Ambrosia artemisiifolia]